MDADILSIANTMLAPCPVIARFFWAWPENPKWPCRNMEQVTDISPLEGIPAATFLQHGGNYVYCIDVDSPYDLADGWRATQAIYDASADGEAPALTFSGKKGYHLLWLIRPQGYTDQASVMAHFEACTRHLYMELQLYQYGLSIGHGKNIDTSIYRRNGVYKLCGARTSGQYGVPISRDDSLATVLAKARDEVPFLLPPIYNILDINVPLYVPPIRPGNGEAHPNDAMLMAHMVEYYNLEVGASVPHPIHGSTGPGNLHIYDNNGWYCFRCMVGGGPISLLAILLELIDCDKLHNSPDKEIFTKAARIAHALGWTSNGAN